MRMLGVPLDSWQSAFLEAAMGVDEAGSWSATESALVVPRQNGKTVALMARALWGAVQGGERLILWTAHHTKTSFEAFMWLKGLVELPEFAVEFGEPKVSVSNGKEGVQLANGNRVLFIARSRTSGRGFSPDLVVLDEAFELGDMALSALLPALSAKKRPAVWYASSAPHDTSTVLRRVALRGRSGDADKLCFFEWAADPDAASSDVAAWLAANPAIGDRLTLEFTASELEALDDEDFRRERLGVWNEEAFPSVFPAQQWARLASPSPSRPSGPKTIAVDVTPDRRRACIAAAGGFGDGRVLVQILEDRSGVSWVVDEVAALVAEHDPNVVLVDNAGQSQTLIAPLERAGISVRRVASSEMVAACGAFYDAVVDGRLLHMDDAPLNAAVEGAVQRLLGDGWAWARRKSTVNVSPLVAASLALFGVVDHKPKERPHIYILAEAPG